MATHTTRPTDRRAAILLLVLAMATLGFSAGPSDGPFADVPADHVFAGSVERLAGAGVTKGCGNDRYCPDDPVTRGQMAAFLTRALQLPAGRAVFRDTRSHLFRGPIAALADAGITRGCGRDRFCPDEPVTRGQMAAFLTRALDLPAGTTTFRDTRGHLFARDVAALADAGVTRGCGGGRFCPDDLVTRGQMAAFLDRAGLLSPRRGDTTPPRDTSSPSTTTDQRPSGATSERPSGATEQRPSGATHDGSSDTTTSHPSDDDRDTTSTGGFDFARWEGTLPTADAVGRGWTATPDNWYALRTGDDVHDVRAVGGSSAAILATEPGVTVSRARLGGADDGLKPAADTSLVDSVVTVSFGEGAHADHVQATDRDGLTLRRVRMIAENEQGSRDIGWNAAVIVHRGSTDWHLEDVYVEAGRDGVAVRSWYPVRLMSGRGHVDGLVIDRATMKSSKAVLVGDDVVIETWRDVFIRESDGSLTPVARP